MGWEVHVNTSASASSGWYRCWGCQKLCWPNGPDCGCTCVLHVDRDSVLEYRCSRCGSVSSEPSVDHCNACDLLWPIETESPADEVEQHPKCRFLNVRGDRRHVEQRSKASFKKAVSRIDARDSSRRCLRNKAKRERTARTGSYQWEYNLY